MPYLAGVASSGHQPARPLDRRPSVRLTGSKATSLSLWALWERVGLRRAQSSRVRENHSERSPLTLPFMENQPMLMRFTARRTTCRVVLLVTACLPMAVRADEPAGKTLPRPKVLILGDSISIGYTPLVRKNLADVADVERP